MLLRFRAVHALCAIASIFIVPAVEASSFNVSPVRVELSKNHLHAALSVTNIGEESVTIQLTPKLWSLVNGTQIEQDTDDLVFSPPIFSIAAHQKQSIRVGLRQYLPSLNEQSYRLVLDEVPIPNQGKSGLAIRTLLKISIPIFIQSSAKEPHSTLTWKLNTSAKSTKLLISNDSNTHIRIQSLAVEEIPNAFPQLKPFYLLPGEKHEIEISNFQIDKGSRTVHVQATTDFGKLDEELTIPFP